MFGNIYNKFFKEKINDVSAKRHCEDPQWFDDNWNELVEYFNTHTTIYISFDYFVQKYLLQTPDIEMLNVLLKHNYNLDSFCERIRIQRNRIFSYGVLSYEVFKWLINNNLVRSDDIKYFDICNKLLYDADLTAFNKFVYAFEFGFPCSDKLIVYVSNVEVAEKIWQYANNSRNINFKYTIGTKIDLQFLKDYIEWIKLHGINDDMGLTSIMPTVARFIGIAGLEVLLLNGYLKPTFLNSTGMNLDVKNWLFSHGFNEFPTQVENLIYNTNPIINNIPDNISVATEKII